MFGQTFYNGIIRKYILWFGTLFNGITINRTDSSGNIIQSAPIPISYASKEKFLARVLGDPNLTKPVAIDLPRMYFLLTSMMYDGERHLNQITKVYNANNAASKISWVYNPVPYNLYFSLGIMVKNAEDGTKILEEILPYFTPAFTATLRLIPEMNIEHDTPLTLNLMTYQDVFEGQFTERKAMMWTLNFEMKCYLYGPINQNGPIKKVYVNFRLPSTNTAAEGVGNTPVSEHIYEQVGLTANGQPTSNAAASIPVADINITDDWGVVVEIINDNENLTKSE